MSPAQKIAASFLLVILCGTLLLMLPISNVDGNFMNPIDALFSATSATCVTGLSTINVSEQLNLFGQIVLMLLIQMCIRDRCRVEDILEYIPPEDI